jgi:hypothetical protein
MGGEAYFSHGKADIGKSFNRIESYVGTIAAFTDRASYCTWCDVRGVRLKCGLGLEPSKLED